jgi:DhnA family fructose-bisphosphate aldolase class Ia
MHGMIGKHRRMSRIVDPMTGHGFGVALDHGLHLGNCPGVEHPEETLDQIVEAGVNAVILSIGTAVQYGARIVRRNGPALILRLDHTTMWREGDLAYADGHTRLIASVEDAVALGADAVITYLFVGHNDPELEDRAFENCAKVNAAARQAGMVHIIETMGARGARCADTADPDLIAAHTRMGMELGADILKTDWPGSSEALRPIAGSLPIPVMLAGGPNGGSDRGTLEFVAQIIAGGGAGVLFGRSIIQAKNPMAVMRATRAIIHDGASVDEAMATAGIVTGTGCGASVG